MVVGRKVTPGCAPVPLRLITCVAGVALSVRVMVALRLPVAVGVNVAATLQLALAANVPTVRQSVPLEGITCAKSPAFVPPRTTLEMVMEALPVLVKVTNCCAVVVPVFTLPKAREFPLRLATGCIAVPLRETVCGLLASGESEIERVAARLVPPEAPGLKITFTTHDPVVATKLNPLVQVLLPRAKSLALVPEIEGVPETVTADEVGLLSVTGCAALGVPTVCEP